MEVGAAQLTQPQLVGHPPGGHINVLADVVKESVISPPCHPGGWSTWKNQILVLSMWDKDAINLIFTKNADKIESL